MIKKYDFKLKPNGLYYEKFACKENSKVFIN